MNFYLGRIKPSEVESPAVNKRGAIFCCRLAIEGDTAVLRLPEYFPKSFGDRPKAGALAFTFTVAPVRTSLELANTGFQAGKAASWGPKFPAHLLPAALPTR
jgi:hypothetical protein